MKEPAFLALGDSYTIGEGVPDEGRWPVQLVARLRESGIAVGAPRIVATTGWTTDELSAAMDAAALQPGYALVTLLIGVNNQYRGRPATEYREQFLALLRRAAALSGDVRRVVVVSIPDWGVTAFAEGRDRAAIGREIDTFNAIARDETLRMHARWVDVTPASREAGAKPGMLVDDGLHPSAAQYAEWVKRIFPEAQAALRELHR
ncbi:SGNH/GDSL hydrolase family protein [Luteibacter sp. RCC_6_2]|jgi:lysophospholipase L1-like esterase|uniref:SGNH/GDSL hydrolase family protein n=1 Tax=Luteibacter sp. RCC_6_2 TaxID=3239223 RepID=UPI003524AF06